MMIHEGMKAPDFSLPDDSGRIWKLSDFSGKPFVLYFYPKDDTPGCTTEACGFRDEYALFREKGVEVVGLSADSAASHAKFRNKYNLPFILLSDTDKKTLNDYGAYGEKVMYGKKVMGVIRSTFLIGADGVVKKAFPKVKPAEHAQEILALL
ncbi:MAG TPA: thioredoxin-dependent thiol peroxidase [Rectinemataceae bacterium]